MPFSLLNTSRLIAYLYHQAVQLLWATAEHCHSFLDVQPPDAIPRWRATSVQL